MAQMSSTQLTPSMSTAFSLPSFASSFETAMPPPSHTASPRSANSHPSAHSPHSSRSNSREPRHTRHFPAPRPYPESNTRTAARDTHSAERPTRKRPAPSDEPDVPQGPSLSLRLHRTEEDPDGDVGMRSDRDQDGDDESSGGSSPSLPHVAVKEEPASDVEQSPSPPPTPAANANTRARPLAAPPQRYALPSSSAGPQTHFAPTPPATARRVSPPHIALPMLPHPHAGSSSNMTLPPMNFPPPSPSHTHHAHSQYQSTVQTQGHTYGDPQLARKRRRVTISGAAGNIAGGGPSKPLHRTVLERAGSGYGQTQLPAPPGASAGPSTPNANSGMVSPVVTPGFNMNSPGALDQVRDTIAIRMEQKALIEQRKNGGGLATVPTPTAPLSRTTNVGSNVAQPPVSRTQGSPSGQSANLPANTLQAPSTSPSQGLAPAPSTSAAPSLLPNHTSDPNTPALTAPPTLAHRRGKNSTKLIIHTPNTSISSSHGGSISNTAGLGLTGTDRPGESGPGLRGLGAPNIEVAIRSAPPGVTRFDPASIGRPQPPLPPHRIPPPPQAQPTPFKERTVPIRRTHANSTAAQNAPSAPLAIVAPGQPLTLNAPAPPSSYIATPTRAQFPPSSQTPHHPTHHVQGTPHHVQNTSHHGHLTPRTTTHHETGPMRPPTSPPISRGAFMAFYDAYAEVHTLRAQIERLEREADRRVESAVRKMREEMREEMRMLRDEIRRNQDGYGRGVDMGYPRERDMGYPRERETGYPRERDMREYGRESGSSRDHAYPPYRDVARDMPPGSSRMAHPHPRPGMQRSGSASVSQSPMQVDKQLHPVDKPPLHSEKSTDRLHPHSRSLAMRKSPGGRVQSSMSPPSRPPSVGVSGGGGDGGGAGKTRSVGKRRARSKSPGNKSGSN